MLQNVKDREPRKRIVGFDEVGHIAVNGIRLLERQFDAKVDKLPNVRRFPLARKSTLKLIGKLRHLMKKLSRSNTCINPKEHTGNGDWVEAFDRKTISFLITYNFITHINGLINWSLGL